MAIVSIWLVGFLDSPQVLLFGNWKNYYDFLPIVVPWQSSRAFPRPRHQWRSRDRLCLSPSDARPDRQLWPIPWWQSPTEWCTAALCYPHSPTLSTCRENNKVRLQACFRSSPSRRSGGDESVRHNQSPFGFRLNPTGEYLAPGREVIGRAMWIR